MRTFQYSDGTLEIFQDNGLHVVMKPNLRAIAESIDSGELTDETIHTVMGCISGSALADGDEDIEGALRRTDDGWSIDGRTYATARDALEFLGAAPHFGSLTRSDALSHLDEFAEWLQNPGRSIPPLRAKLAQRLADLLSQERARLQKLRGAVRGDPEEIKAKLLEYSRESAELQKILVDELANANNRSTLVSRLTDPKQTKSYPYNHHYRLVSTFAS